MSIFSTLGKGISHATDLFRGDAGREHGMQFPEMHQPAAEYLGSGGGSISAIMSAFGHLVDGVAPMPMQTAALGKKVATDGIGWDRPEHGNAPYAYAHRNKSGYGLDYGFGLRGHNPVLGTDMDSLAFNGSTGLIENEKGTRFGTTFKAGETRGDGHLGPAEFDYGAGTANFDWTAGTDGISLGGGVNAVEGSAKGDAFGNKVRIGGGVGEGLGVRAHWGDDDGNGLRDIGFGVDVLDGSIDLTSETPHKLWNWLVD